MFLAKSYQKGLEAHPPPPVVAHIPKKKLKKLQKRLFRACFEPPGFQHLPVVEGKGNVAAAEDVGRGGGCGAVWDGNGGSIPPLSRLLPSLPRPPHLVGTLQAHHPVWLRYMYY